MLYTNKFEGFYDFCDLMLYFFAVNANIQGTYVHSVRTGA